MSTSPSPPKRKASNDNDASSSSSSKKKRKLDGGDGGPRCLELDPSESRIFTFDPRVVYDHKAFVWPERFKGIGSQKAACDSGTDSQKAACLSGATDNPVFRCETLHSEEDVQKYEMKSDTSNAYYKDSYRRIYEAIQRQRPEQRHWYEVMMDEYNGCALFVDVDFSLEQLKLLRYTADDVFTAERHFVAKLCEYLVEKSPVVDDGLLAIMILDATNLEKKVSRHIIIHATKSIFGSAPDIGVFMEEFWQDLRATGAAQERKDYPILYDDNLDVRKAHPKVFRSCMTDHFYDTGVYTSNRQLRPLGSSKASSPDRVLYLVTGPGSCVRVENKNTSYRKGGDPTLPSFEMWVSTMVQARCSDTTLHRITYDSTRRKKTKNSTTTTILDRKISPSSSSSSSSSSHHFGKNSSSVYAAFSKFLETHYIGCARHQHTPSVDVTKIVKHGQDYKIETRCHFCVLHERDHEKQHVGFSVDNPVLNFTMNPQGVQIEQFCYHTRHTPAVADAAWCVPLPLHLIQLLIEKG